jgi:alkylhydroperoxidase family enzyme
MSNTPRIAPFEPPYDDELAEQLQKWMPPGSSFEPLKLFRTLAHNRELFSRMRPLGSGILGRTSTITPQEREIVIDRTCARCNCEYEWGVHVTAFGNLLAIPPEKLEGTVTAHADDARWTARESLLIRLVDELCDTSTISDETWDKLTKHYSDVQLIELVIIVGWYHVIAFVNNALKIELEDWAARFSLNG